VDVQFSMDSRYTGHCSSVKISFGDLVCKFLLSLLIVLVVVVLVVVVAVATTFVARIANNNTRTKNRDKGTVIVNTSYLTLSVCGGVMRPDHGRSRSPFLGHSFRRLIHDGIESRDFVESRMQDLSPERSPLTTVRSVVVMMNERSADTNSLST
jgi:hypothetical protein